MTREGAVGLEVALDDVELGESSENRGQHGTGHSVRSVDDHAQGPDRLLVDEREDLLDEGRPHVLLAHVSAPLDRCKGNERALPDVVEAGVAADRERPAPHDLHARVVLRVAAVEPELADGEIDHLGSHEPEIEHVRATVRRALDGGGRHRRGREAHVPPDADRARLEVLDVCSRDPVRAVLVELRWIEAAHVVRFEDLGIEHASML